MHDHDLEVLVDSDVLDVLDDRVFQPQQGSPCRDELNAVLRSMVTDSRQARHLTRERRSLHDGPSPTHGYVRRAHFRHPLAKYELDRKLPESQAEMFEEQGWIMRGGSIVDATIIAASSPVKNAAGARDPEMCQTKKGNQWTFGMKSRIGVDAGTGYVRSVTATAASVHDLDQVAHLVRADDGRRVRRRRLPGSRQAP